MMNNRPPSRALIIQLARLGDLVQSIPAINALKAADPARDIDLLCMAPLAPLARLIPAVSQVLGWDPRQFHVFVKMANELPTLAPAIEQAGTHLARFRKPMTPCHGFPLNQHPTAMLLAHLVADTISGTGAAGALSSTLVPWAAYLRHVAAAHIENQVHLSDAFCGLCQVRPLGQRPTLRIPSDPLPGRLDAIGRGSGRWLAVILGAGDPVRIVPQPVWRQWIVCLLETYPDLQIVLVGGSQNSAMAMGLEDTLPSTALARIRNAVGRTTLPQLVTLLARCEWAIGSDTGPLHVAAAAGATCLGLYFARARIHETGPYSHNQWVWQAVSQDPLSPTDEVHPQTWPIAASLPFFAPSASPDPMTTCPGWQLWRTRLDAWGVTATNPHIPDVDRRPTVWGNLSPELVQTPQESTAAVASEESACPI